MELRSVFCFFFVWMDAKHYIQLHCYLFVPCRNWGRNIRPREALLVSCGLSTYVTIPRESFKLQCLCLRYVCEAKAFKSGTDLS